MPHPPSPCYPSYHHQSFSDWYHQHRSILSSQWQQRHKVICPSRDTTDVGTFSLSFDTTDAWASFPFSGTTMQEHFYLTVTPPAQGQFFLTLMSGHDFLHHCYCKIYYEIEFYICFSALAGGGRLDIFALGTKWPCPGTGDVALSRVANGFLCYCQFLNFICWAMESQWRDWQREVTDTEWLVKWMSLVAACKGGILKGRGIKTCKRGFPKCWFPHSRSCRVEQSPLLYLLAALVILLIIHVNCLIAMNWHSAILISVGSLPALRIQ